MFKKSIIILLTLLAFSCGNKKDKENSDTAIVVDSTELKQEIDSLENFTEEIKNTEESIEASIKKIEDLLNDIEN